jgi:tellurite resistance protein TehA-like permease
VAKTKTKMVKYHFAFAHFVVVLILILPLNGRNGAKGKFQNSVWQKPVWQKQNFPVGTSFDSLEEAYKFYNH